MITFQAILLLLCLPLILCNQPKSSDSHQADEVAVVNDEDAEYIYHIVVTIPSSYLKSRRPTESVEVRPTQEKLNDIASELKATVFKQDHHPDKAGTSASLTPDFLRKEYNMDTVVVVAPGPAYKDSDAFLIFANVKCRGADGCYSNFGLNDDAVTAIRDTLRRTLGDHPDGPEDLQRLLERKADAQKAKLLQAKERKIARLYETQTAKNENLKGKEDKINDMYKAECKQVDKEVQSRSAILEKQHLDPAKADRNGNAHAEMQGLKRLQDTKLGLGKIDRLMQKVIPNWKHDGFVIGISKPACTGCATHLQAHSQNVPSLSKRHDYGIPQPPTLHNTSGPRDVAQRKQRAMNEYLQAHNDALEQHGIAHLINRKGNEVYPADLTHHQVEVVGNLFSPREGAFPVNERSFVHPNEIEVSVTHEFALDNTPIRRGPKTPKDDFKWKT